MQIERYKQIEKSLGQVYCHVTTGGTTFEVGEDAKGHPVIRVMSTHFGNVTGLLELGVTREKLVELFQLFHVAQSHIFSGGASSTAAH